MWGAESITAELVVFVPLTISVYITMYGRIRIPPARFWIICALAPAAPFLMMILRHAVKVCFAIILWIAFWMPWVVIAKLTHD